MFQHTNSTTPQHKPKQVNFGTMPFVEDTLNNNNICKSLEHSPSIQNGGSTPLPPGVCFLCVEKCMPDPTCRSCQNIRTYRSNKERDDLELVTTNVSFPGPGIVRRNHIYGNYVVASRTIEPGELIILEKPITTGPYAPLDILPVCVACCRDIGLSTKCSKCSWPVCGDTCEKSNIHAENECNLFAGNNVKPKGVVNENFCVETLRALLLKRSDPLAWKRILEFEPHIQSRSEDYLAKATTEYIINFIQEKCNLAGEFSAETIDHVVGVLSINSFWIFKELKIYASCLFDKITLLAHDCDPNTDRKLVFLGEDAAGESGHEMNGSFQHISNIALKITAARRIFPGEIISIRYIQLNQPVAKRRAELKETFYFECTCSRCLSELAGEPEPEC